MENAVDIVRPKKLSNGQLALYRLFCQSVEEKRVLKRDEIFEIYKTKVAAGRGYRQAYDHDRKVWYEVLRDWSEWRWKVNFEGWFTQSLGSMLKKGYLRVVPAIDFSEVDDNMVKSIVE